MTIGDVRQVLTVPGDVTPAHTENLSFSAGGRLVQVGVQAGDQVTQGQALASIDPQPLKLALAQAQADFQVKQDALDQAKLSSPADSATVKQAEADALASQIALDQAEEDLTGATMLAPFSGRVLSVSGNTGDTVTANTTFVELADLSQLEIEASVGQEDVTTVQVGQAADLSFDAVPGKTFPGKVSRIVPTRASSSVAVTYTAYISVEQAPPGLLPGTTADADIIVAERQNVLTLPRRSIRATANATVSVNVLERGQTVSRNVEIGVVGDLNVEIVSGLQEGDQV
ncbi:MAG: efflux RND transporter periplasmic adaptor subunit, partial [Chloroflexi bacterium]|nr:efflux RND transporter periplasmic adaptor subunit [Chloroflexota bacterium]